MPTAFQVRLIETPGVDIGSSTRQTSSEPSSTEA